jgi:ribose-phosphate pyrophosphokinase
VHGIFCARAAERLAEAGLEEVVVTDTVPLNDRARALGDRVSVLSVAGLLAEAIQRIHTNESISAMFGDLSEETP